MLLYFIDTDDEISFAIFEEDENTTKKALSFLSNAFGKSFEEVTDSWAEEYTFEKNTLIIESRFFNEDILEVVEKGFDIHII